MIIKEKKKKINFKLHNHKYKDKIRHIIHDSKDLESIKGWEAERLQREKLFEGITDADDEDIILFSDSDEIPNPELLKNFFLNKKFAIFMQKFFVYKLNIYNEHETPWEGTRACKKKNLKSFYHLRKKIVKKNLLKPFWKIYLEKNIEILGNGGWHFNNLYSVETISKKLKAAPHQEFNSDKLSYEEILNFFFEIHDPTTLNKQGPDIGSQYRSEIFYLNLKQKEIAEKVFLKFNEKFNGKIVTKISEIKNYCKAEDYHQKYLEKKY